MAEQMDSESDTFLFEEEIDTDKYMSESGKFILREWLKENWKHSIPSEIELENLATKTGSTKEAVKYVLSNIRLKFLVEWIGKEKCGNPNEFFEINSMGNPAEQEKPKEETLLQEQNKSKEDQSSSKKNSKENKPFQKQKSHEDEQFRQQNKSKNCQQSKQLMEIKENSHSQQHQEDSDKKKVMLKSDSCRECFLAICTDENVRKKILMYKNYFYLQEQERKNQNEDYMDVKDAWKKNIIFKDQIISDLMELQDIETQPELLSDIDEVSENLKDETQIIKLYKERLILQKESL